MLKTREMVKETCAGFGLTKFELRRVADLMQKEICKGLGKETNCEADVKGYPTYVRQIPNGSERGKFLALDLGGTNFRALLIELGDQHKIETLSKSFVVPQKIMLGCDIELFDYIANSLAEFMKENGVNGARLSLGFTFSFPLNQEGLAKGILMKWTKGFKCEGVEGKDVVKMLQEALTRAEVDVEVVAVLNDTTGTVMSCAYRNTNCRVGIIIGTGTNACYLEKLDNVELWEGDRDEPCHVFINTEWGSFGGNGCLDFIRTKFDKEIDEESLNPGEQVYEKMISGMFMGEVVRLVLVKLVEQKVLFGGKASDLLIKKGSFHSKYISEIESDKQGEFHKCMDILQELGLKLISNQDCVDIRYVCEMVSRRAAQLAAAGVACLLNKMNEKEVVVGVDGSVYRYHPHFHKVMKATIEELLNDDIKFEMVLEEDGSGKGAALLAAAAFKQ